MNELVPWVLSCTAGCAMAAMPRGPIRTFSTVVAVLALAIASTVLSGEAVVSWRYLGLDLAESAAGFGAGCLMYVMFVRMSKRQQVRRVLLNKPRV